MILILVCDDRHLGTSVCVYLRGRLILYVLGGVYRSSTTALSEEGSWRPVDEHTLFMSYSVSKGVTAMVLLSLVDKGLVSYDERVVELWPEFGEAAGKKNITIGDAVSHRAGLGSLIPFSLHTLLGCIRGHWVGDWRVAWRAGERFVETIVPEFEVGAYARYHPVSFSWIIGGIIKRVIHRDRIRHARAGDALDDVHCKSVSDIMRDTIAEVCGCRADAFIGLEALPAAEMGRVALLEPMRPALYKYPNPMSELRIVETLKSNAPPSLRYVPSFVKKFLCFISFAFFWCVALMESIFCCALANSNIWRGICLPSSNGFFTSQAVAIMYGALANGGEVEVLDHKNTAEVTQCEGENDHKVHRRKIRVFSEQIVEKLFSEVVDESTAVPMHNLHVDKGSWGRHSKGFSPWPLPTLHGVENMHCTIGHQGMGGCSSFGCAETGLAVCIMRNVYDPLVISEGAVKLDDGLLAQIIRDSLS